MTEPIGIPDKLPATSDVVQRARQALDAWPGQPITDDDRRVNAVIGSVTVAQYDLVRELLELVEVALPTVTAQRDDAVAEVASIRDELAKDLPDTTIRHKGDTARAIAHLTAERDTARILAQRLEDNSAALDRARAFIDKQVAVSEAHLDSDDHNIAAIADATLSLLRRIDQALDGKTTS